MNKNEIVERNLDELDYWLEELGYSELLNEKTFEKVKQETDKLNLEDLQEYFKLVKNVFENKDVCENENLIKAVSDAYSVDLSLDNLKSINEIVNLDRNNSYVEEYFDINDITESDNLWDNLDQRLREEGMSNWGVLNMSLKLWNLEEEEEDRYFKINAWQNNISIVEKSDIIKDVLNTLTLDLKDKQTKDKAITM